MQKNQNSEIGTRISPNGMQFGDLMQSAAKALIQDASTYRKRVKPLYARFKAKIKYADGNCQPMFSIDACKEYEDNEEMGFRNLYNWVVKCHSAGLIDSIQIYITLDRFKDTNKMNYNTRVLFWSAKFNTIDQYRTCIIPQLRFMPNGSVNLERFKINE